jgi:hypothetical protein
MLVTGRRNSRAAVATNMALLTIIGPQHPAPGEPPLISTQRRLVHFEGIIAALA